MELKLSDKITAAVEIDGRSVVGFGDSQVYESIGSEEAFIYIRSASDGREVKIKFTKKTPQDGQTD